MNKMLGFGNVSVIEVPIPPKPSARGIARVGLRKALVKAERLVMNPDGFDLGRMVDEEHDMLAELMRAARALIDAEAGPKEA